VQCLFNEFNIHFKLTSCQVSSSCSWTNFQNFSGLIGAHFMPPVQQATVQQFSSLSSPSVHWSTNRSISPLIRQSISPPIQKFTSLLVHQSTRSLVHRSTPHPSKNTLVHPSNSPSVHQSIRPPVHPSTSQPLHPSIVHSPAVQQLSSHDNKLIVDQYTSTMIHLPTSPPVNLSVRQSTSLPANQFNSLKAHQ
jgi:hypothetical protein